MKKVTLQLNSQSEINYRLLRDEMLNYYRSENPCSQIDDCDCDHCTRMQKRKRTHDDEVRTLQAAALFFMIANECHCGEYDCAFCAPF